MHRRHFVQLASAAGLSSLLSNPLPARAQAGSTNPNTPTIVLPNQWSGKTLTAGLPRQPQSTGTRQRPGSRTPGLRNPNTSAAPRQPGTIHIGAGAPSGPSLSVPQSLIDQKIVHNVDSGLDLAELNRSFNAFLQHPLGGPFTAPGDVYLGRAFVPVRAIMAGVLPQTSGGTVTPALQNALAALSEVAVLRTPADQFKISSGFGNQVVFYESEGQAKIGHKHIDRLIEEFNITHRVRLLKVMSYLHAAAADTGSQGGKPDEIVSGGSQLGTHHVGGFSLGYRKADGSGPVTLKGDWPANYGQLDDENERYNAHLIAVDYRGGAIDPIPEETIASYNRNADLWDCCACAIVPFTGLELDPRYQNYEKNPLEIYDQASAIAVAQDLARFNTEHFLKRHGAFYCAEGQFVVANLGPQEGTLLKRSKFGTSEFGKRIDNFRNAPGYAGMTEQQRRRTPELGWTHLKSLGSERGGISSEQHDALVQTGRTATALEWIPEETKGWQAYRPRQSDGLIARPMTVATLAWGVFRNYMPLDGLARVISDDIIRAFQAGDATVKAAITQMCGNVSPTTPAGAAIVSGIGLKAAVGFTIGLLSNPLVRAKLLEQAGADEIEKPSEKAKVDAAYAAFLETLKAADFTSPRSVDQALKKADQQLAQLRVERKHYNKVTKQYTLMEQSLMRYAAPACIFLWAQHPVLAETDCLRYVATAMHTKQAKARPV